MRSRLRGETTTVRVPGHAVDATYRGRRDHHPERRMRSALRRLFSRNDAGTANLERSLEQRPAPGPAGAS